MERPERGAVSFIDFPLFGPWGRWFPYYNNRFGYVSYDPWGSYYGGTRWRWSRYGWYSPFWYDPFYDDYYYGGGGGGGRYEDEHDRDSREVGSVRLRANRADASVYIDGVLVGKVDDFDGFSNHLELEPGTHQLELRLDGYETYAGEISVEVGKTRTERLTLKKKQ